MKISQLYFLLLFILYSLKTTYSSVLKIITTQSFAAKTTKPNKTQKANMNSIASICSKIAPVFDCIARFSY